MTQIETRIDGILLDEAVTVDLAELTRLCGSSGRTVRLMVTEGLLRPSGTLPEEWRFDGIEIRRARRAVRLQRDLELNLPGTALALDLLEELECLRERLRILEHQLGPRRSREPS
ncbi:MAG: MerR family transcriptional regulator [Sphingobacteriia bacterium]|nr:MerR family transcriptional regulator [Sphingobacteriia bacterium]NCC40714.1 MerR family transcriptional regulator [Gammaproteobacteria bacterium]